MLNLKSTTAVYISLLIDLSLNMIPDVNHLNSLKKHLIESLLGLFNIHNIHVSIYGYAQDIKMYCNWCNSLGKLKDCIQEIGTVNALPQQRNIVNL